jgi:hypothetical protein
MLRNLVKIGVICLTLIGTLFIFGCSDAESTALLGTAAGAGIGSLAGGDTESTLMGAAIGGGAGYVIGNESDKKKTQQQIDQLRAEQNVVTVWITNSNGSRTPVRLRRQGPSYVGPNGEVYNNMPTEDELRPIYGF